MSRKNSSSGFLKRNVELLGTILKILDLVAIAMGGLIGHYIRLDAITLEPEAKIAFLFVLLSALILFPLFDIYKPWRGRSLWGEVRAVLLAWLSVAAMGLIFAYFTKTGAVYSRLWVGYWALISAVWLVCIRVATRASLKWARKKGYKRHNILIVGAGDLGRQISRRLAENSWSGIRVIGFVDDCPEFQDTKIKGVPVVGGTEQLRELVNGEGANSGKSSQKGFNWKQVDQVWVALPLSDEAKIKQTCRMLENSAIPIIFVPDIFAHSLFNHSVDDLAGIPVINLRASTISGGSQVLKMLEDVVVSLSAIILTAPLMLLIAVVIKLEGHGPVLFKQRRYGIDGREIEVWKFRTMRVMEDGEKITQATENDPRITKFGAFLRRTSLDEFPQFFNVLQGRMSVVGPRPHAVAHNEEYRRIIDHYMWRHSVKPGITGYAQVSGWRGETNTKAKMEKRVEFDLEYLSNWSIWLDLKIIILTLREIIICRAY